ncbi:MAG: class A beta-lactamase-related serine hydrolase [Cytophagaceae bacterium]|nr:class A beta-lactamase-related serine hydrolase [Cytophagaceae bacterium]
MKKIFLLFLLTVPAFAQKTDAVLEARLKTLTANFRGDVGIYVRHLTKNKAVAINADTLFPTASLIKVPITIGLFDKIERGELDYHATLTYRDSLLYAGEDILGSFKDGEKIALSKVAMLMITTSDNTASLWCQSLAGTGTAINNWLQTNGFQATRVNSRTPGRRSDWQRYGWGQTTPREMAELLVRIRAGKVINPAASERIYRNLVRIYYDGESLSQLPPTVQVASKQGAVDQSRSEVVLVNAPSGDYVFCVITKNQKDESWERTNEGYELLRAVSKLLWEYFEPKRSYRRPAGWAKW